MEWFGLTHCGFPDPIKDMMRPDYKEPEVQEDVLKTLAKGETKKTFSELIAVIDCYTGNVDGNAYKSYDRLMRMRKKGVFKPLEPNDMYSYAGTNAMKFGFWGKDPALQGEDWYKNRVYAPKPSCDITQYVHEMKKSDKFFRL